MAVQSREKLLFGGLNIEHNLAFPAVAQFAGSVEHLQMPNILREFQGEVLPAAPLHQTLPRADVAVSGTVVFDMVRHPTFVQSRCIDHTLKSVFDFCITYFNVSAAFLAQ